MRVITALVVAVLALPPGAFAQEGQALDPGRMGVDLNRIKRELEQTSDAESDDPLRLRFRVEVVGVAPKIDFLEGFNVEGPLPYGSPTHQEVLDVITPREFRAPVFPVFGLAMVAAQKLTEYTRKKQCEAEIEEYRRLVMQGVAMAAPRCSR